MAAEEYHRACRTYKANDVIGAFSNACACMWIQAHWRWLNLLLLIYHPYNARMTSYLKLWTRWNETIIKLIHDKFENDFGFMSGKEDCNLDEIVEELTKLECTHMPNRIYTWGSKVDTSVPMDFDIAFDLTLLCTNINDTTNFRSMTGNDQEIQDSIMCHPRFLSLVETILNTVNEEKPHEIGFICNFGKHRSVGWANIMHEYFYKRSVIHHYTLKS